MSRILRIDLTAETYSWQELPERYRGLGGRGLTSAVVADEVPAGADPLGPENVVVLAPGLLAGTTVPNSGRLSVGAKSPLTGGIKEANSGGSVAQKLARLGAAAVVFTGRAAAPVKVLIGADGVTFVPAGGLWGKGNYEAVEALRAEHPDCGLVTVGPAGEKGLKASAVCVTTPDYHLRTASRGGLGAVLGAKRVKAVVVDDAGTGSVPLADPERFKAASRALAEAIAGSPVSQGLQVLGTAMMVSLIDELGGLPTRNYSAGRFEGAGKINADAVKANLEGRPGASPKHRCMNGCVIHCSNVYTDPQGAFVTSGFEYETLCLVGSNCAIDDPDAIARIDRACDDLGLDTIETGAALAVAMEGGRIPWGDGARALATVKSILRDDPLGLAVANGCVAAGAHCGVTRVPAVKGQSMAAYDPRRLKGTGVTYATSPMGADHTAGNVLPNPAMPDYDPGSPEGQHLVSAHVQSLMAAVDSLGLCLFAALSVVGNPDLEAELAAAVGAKLGRDLPGNSVADLGRRVILGEIAFNRKAGFSARDDRLPAFFREEPLSPLGFLWDVADEDLDRAFTGG